MAIEFIGRKLEKEVLKEAIDSSEAEMVAVIGRRRIGKTFLITSAYAQQIVFEISGLQTVSLEGQLKNFAAQLTKVINPDFPIKTPTAWFEAFQLLINYLKPSWVMITALGFKPNTHSLELIENHITLEALFEDISLDF